MIEQVFLGYWFQRTRLHMDEFWAMLDEHSNHLPLYVVKRATKLVTYRIKPTKLAEKLNINK